MKCAFFTANKLELGDNILTETSFNRAKWVVEEKFNLWAVKRWTSSVTLYQFT